jgi:hypothetical protein
MQQTSVKNKAVSWGDLYVLHILSCYVIGFPVRYGGVFKAMHYLKWTNNTSAILTDSLVGTKKAHIFPFGLRRAELTSQL